MLGLELADDVTAKRRRSSRLPSSSFPSVRSENPALAVGRLPSHSKSGRSLRKDLFWKGLYESGNPTQGDNRLASTNFRQHDFKQLSPEGQFHQTAGPRKHQHSDSRDCPMTRRSTCRCALSVAKQQNVVKRGASPLEDASEIFGGHRSRFEPGLLRRRSWPNRQRRRPYLPAHRYETLWEPCRTSRHKAASGRTALNRDGTTRASAPA